MKLYNLRKKAADDALYSFDMERNNIIAVGEVSSWISDDKNNEWRCTLSHVEGVVMPDFNCIFAVKFYPKSAKVVSCYLAINKI